MNRLFLALVLAPSVSFADGVSVFFLGEQHDNPAHHTRQAERVAEITPTALVFEMLTPDQAARITPELIKDEAALEAALGWNDSGWPDFAMYYPIFAAAPQAAYVGAAVPRAQARAVMSDGIAAAFGPKAAHYGLIDPLPPDQQDAREALQLAAHCDAMPAEMLPVMVDIQRYRDAVIARATVSAVADYGAPVAVITGNGHARTDWGAPASLARVAPDLTVHALGQGETGFGAPSGTFTEVEIGPDVDREDPCLAFRKSN